MTNNAEKIETNCEPLIDADAAAVLLKVHPKTIKRLAAQGHIPAMRIGKLWRFRGSELDEAIRSALKSSRHPCPPDLKGEEQR